ncbi:MAG: ATP-binding protein [Patescibacteria group bacterium]
MSGNIKRSSDLEKINAALIESPIPMIITDPEAKILFTNKGIETMTGYAIEEVLGKTPSIWGGQMSRDFYADLWDTIKSKKEIFIGELTNKNKAGQLFPAQVEIAPILNKEGEVDFYVGTYQDIGKIKEVGRAQNEFVALVSHQLRTPLTAVKWLIEILLQEKYGVLTDKQEEAMINIYNSNERLITLVNDLLNASRIESGGIMASLSPIDLIEETKEIIKIYKPLAYSNKQKIIFNYREIPKLINADKILYSQIVQNLLSNALIYGEKNSDIIISLEKDREYITVRVVNSGYPISLMEQKSLFTKFFRGEEAKKVNTRGSGLGLYIVKEAVGKLGGKVDFSSTKEKTEFYFTIPLKGPEAKPAIKK